MQPRGLRRLCAEAAARRCQVLRKSSRCLSAESASSSPSSSTESKETQVFSATEATSQAEKCLHETSPEILFTSEASSPDPTSSPHEHSHSSNHKPFWTALKALVAGSLVTGTVSAAYITYAFTPEEISKKVSALQASTEVGHSEEDNLLQKAQHALYSNGVKAVALLGRTYLDARQSVEQQLKGFAAPTSDKLLPDLLPQERHVFTLVLDLNETLVYSDWTRDRGWRTFKRPGAEAFLEHLAQFYELVIYTDQLPFTVDPILEKLDQKGCIRYRLAREATQYIHGKHFKDLSKLNRDPAHVLFLSAHAKETCLQPENAVPMKPWKLESDDTGLLDMLPFLEYVARYRPADVRSVLASYKGHDIPSEFLVRSKDYQRKMRELKSQNPFFKSSRSSQ